MTKYLRDYQLDTIAATKAFFDGHQRSGIIHIFTGGGKTFIASQIFRDKEIIDFSEHTALFLAPAITLVHQTAMEFRNDIPELSGTVMVDIGGGRQLTKPGIGIVMGNINEVDARLMVGSIQTLIDREDKESNNYKKIERDDFYIDELGRITLNFTSERDYLVSKRMDEILAESGVPELVIGDECHHMIADGSRILIERLNQINEALSKSKVKLIGMTATPWREDDLGLFNLFDNFIISRPFTWAQKKGYCAILSPPIRVQATVETPDGDQVRNAAKMTNIGEIVLKAYREHGENRPFIYTAASVETSEDVHRLLRKEGVRVAHIDGMKVLDKEGKELPTEQRARIFREFERGEYDGLCNFGTLNEGVNLPWVSLLMWGRPTDNALLLTQAVGRVVRTYDGNDNWPKKDEAMLIDFTGRQLVVMPHGTLLGTKVREIDLEKLDELLDENEEDELLAAEGKDFLQNIIIGSENVYKVTKIISKEQRGDLYHDERTHTFSLIVGLNDSMFIVPPNWSYHDRLRAFYLNNVDKIDDSNKSYFDMIQAGMYMFSKFNLWHVFKDGYGRWNVKNGRPVVAGELPDIVNQCIMYAYDNIYSMNPTLMQKKKSWKYGSITQKQKKLLTSIKERYRLDIDVETMKKGKAAKVIGHHFAAPPVFQILKKTNQKLEQIIARGV